MKSSSHQHAARRRRAQPCMGCGGLPSEGRWRGLSDGGQNYQIVERAHLSVAAQARRATGREWATGALSQAVGGEDARSRRGGGSNWARVAGVGYGQSEESEKQDRVVTLRDARCAWTWAAAAAARLCRLFSLVADRKGGAVEEPQLTRDNHTAVPASPARFHRFPPSPGKAEAVSPPSTYLPAYLPST
jgi:hypothetical protein